MQSTESKKVEIFISGRNLRDKDLFSKSDPYVVFYLKNNQNNQYIKVDRTETIQNNLNPNFSKSFIVDFIFEQKQDCKFEVYDDDGTTSDFLGSCETTIGKIMGAQKQLSILDIKLKNSNQTQGKLVIRGDVVKESNEFVFMKFSGIKLMNTDGWFDKSDPLLRISKIREDRTIQKIFETEHIMDNLNPSWKPFELQVGRLCDADHNKNFKIEVWDWEKNGKFQFIGEKEVSLNQLKQQKEFELSNHKKKNPGKIRLDQFQIIIKPSFLDYIRGGLQLNLILAVDFTGSNGAPNSPTSLHYMNPNFMNQYQQAIHTVGEILLAYDYDQKIPCYGFGAKTRFPNLQSNTTLHCFPLSGNPANVESFGLQNMMELYNYALHNVELSGPTYFAPIINESIKIAQQIKSQEQDIYTILLILTDGEIHDMNQTKNLIVSASQLPLSIIIVGIGQADFGNMDILDGDSGLTDELGRKATRDLVQFVPYRNFNGNPSALAKHVLAEIPDQVVKYNQLIGKKPNKAVSVDLDQVGYQSVRPSVQQFPPGQNMPPPGQNMQVPGGQMPPPGGPMPYQGGPQAPSGPVPPPGQFMPPQGMGYSMNQSQPYGSYQSQQQPPPPMGQQQQHFQSPSAYQSGLNQQGPPPFSQGPPPLQQGPPPFQQGPPPYQQGPPPYQQGPPPYQQGPPPQMGQSYAYNQNSQKNYGAQQSYQSGPPPQNYNPGLYQSNNHYQQEIPNLMMGSQPGPQQGQQQNKYHP